MRRVEPTLGRRAVSIAAAASLSMVARAIDATPASATARVPTYREMVKTWHTPPAEEPTKTPEGRPSLVLEMINTGERIELSPQRDDGGFGPAELERAAHALRDQHSDKECATDPRLLDLTYQIELHFQ